MSDSPTTKPKSDPVLGDPEEDAVEESLIDLGDLFAKRLEKNKEAITVKAKVVLVPGLNLRVLDTPAVVSQLRLSDAENDNGAFLNAIYALVHEDDRPALARFLNQDGVDAEMLLDIYRTLVEAGADGRPTKRSPNSRATSTRKRRTAS